MDSNPFSFSIELKTNICVSITWEVREVFKNPSNGNFPLRGWGVPPFSAKKKSVKNWPKNSVFKAKNAVFGEFLASRRPLRGGGVPPFSAKKFLLTFRPAEVR